MNISLSDSNESPTLDEKTEKLNQSGAFLQLNTLNEVTKRGWGSETETPRTVMPFIKNPIDQRQILYQGDANKFDHEKFPEAIIESQNHNEREELSLDVYCGKTFDFVNVRLVIEVKKRNPDYVDWCFLQLEKNASNMQIITKQLKNEGNTTLFHIPPSRKYSNDIWIQHRTFPEIGFLTNKISDFAIALKSRNLDRNYFKSEKTEVDKPAIQILKGLFGTIIEDVQHQVISGTGYENKPTLFIPIVITNANLFLVEADPKDIDSKTGTITKDPEYTPIDSIIYEYPTPNAIQYPEPLHSQQTSYTRRIILKSHVLVVNPQGFVELLSNFDKILSA